MSTLLAALLISLAGVALAALFQLSYRRERRARLAGLELRPNCLLTRYPIVFLAGRKSLFRLFDHWNEVPAYLREHGYEVLVVEPPPKHKPFQAMELLEGLPSKIHIVADSSLQRELEALARMKHPKIVTLTRIQNPRAIQSPLAPPSVEDFKPLGTAIEIFSLAVADAEFQKNWKSGLTRLLTAAHNRLTLKSPTRVDALETATLATRSPWSIETRFLDLAVTLAERDACSGTFRG